MGSKQINVPSDRSTKQPAMGFCRNPECAEDGDEFHFPVKHAEVACPKCGANQSPMIGLLVLTHLLVKDPDGAIKCKSGRYRLACNTNNDRKYLATRTNMEAATDQYEVANCPGCLAEAEKLGIKPKIWKYEG